ncbi:MAG: hypothetical protein KDA22_13125 [Phycisphaerales bacterium]|nr:hypothetical protein [Phycisphaerales bacterium]
MTTPTPDPTHQLQLTKFDARTFVGQTIHLAGGAFINCTFDSCTLVLSNTPFVLQGGRFARCNWRIEYDVLWGAPETRAGLRRVLDMIDSAPEAPKTEGAAPKQ